jgi:PadR family transcriptional regulator PadR
MPLPKSDLPQGTLDLLILKTVALGPLHGYGIAQRLQLSSQSVIRVNQGSLYPALHRLEKRKWLAAEWKPSDTGRESRFYRLTPRGRQAMEQESKKWERLTGAISTILRQVKGGSQ